MHGHQPIISEVTSTHELDKVLLEQRGDRGLEQALEVTPNLKLRVGGKGIPRIDVRGLKSRHIKFLVNGIPFNSTFDGQFDPTFIPTAQIDRVKVSVGGVSESYGEGSMGVIDVLTRSTREDQVNLNMELGANNYSHVSASMGGNKQQLDYFVNLTHRDRDSIELSDDFVPTAEEDGGDRLNSDRERLTAFGSISYQLNDELQLGLTASLLKGEYGIPPTILKDAYASEPKFERIEDQKGYSLQGSYSYEPNNNYYLRGWIYTNKLEQDENRFDSAQFDSIDDPTHKGSFLTETTTTISGLGTQLGWDLAAGSRVTFGLDLHTNAWEQTGIIRDLKVNTGSSNSGGGNGSGGNGSGGGNSSGGSNSSSDGNGSGGGNQNTTSVATYDLRHLNEHERTNAYSFTAEYESNLTDSLDLVIGTGYHQLRSNDIDNKSSNSYLLGFSYRVNSDIKLHSSWVRKIRLPSIRNLFDASRGNLNLDEEVLTGTEAGLDLAVSETTNIGITAFHYIVDDLIQRNRTTDLFENIESARIQGLEFSLVSQPIDKLQARLSMSIQDSEDRSNTGRRELVNTPARTANLDLDYTLGFGLAAHMKYQHISDQYYYTRNSPFIRDKLDDIDRLDLRLRWKSPNGNITTYVGIDNLLDKDFADEYALPSPGRMLFFGASFQH